MKKSTSILWANLGNLVEVYEYCLFGFLAPVMSLYFFPHQSMGQGLILTFLIFAIAHLARPFGGMILGHIGDKYGRNRALVISALLISLSSLLMAILPGYYVLGMFAPVLLLLVRLMQGLFFSGEYCGAIIYSGELAPSNQRAFYSSWVNSLGGIGILLCSVTLFVLYRSVDGGKLLTWGWRYCYLFASVLGLLLYIKRRYLQETPVFRQLQKQSQVSQWPLLGAIRQEWRLMLKIIFLLPMSAVSFTIIAVFMPAFLLEQAHVTPTFATLINAGSVVLMIGLIPLFAMLSDRLGRKPILIAAAIGFITCALPCFHLILTGKLSAVIIGVGLLSVCSALSQSTTPALLMELLAARTRYSALGVSFNIGFAFFSGTAPLMVSYLIVVLRSQLAPAYYLLGASMITLVVLLLFIPETFRKEIGE